MSSKKRKKKEKREEDRAWEQLIFGYNGGLYSEELQRASIAIKIEAHRRAIRFLEKFRRDHGL